MIFRNSRLIFAVLIPIAIILFIVLADNIYSIVANSAEVSELLNSSRQTDELRIRAQITRAARLEAAEDIEAFERLVLSEDKFVDLIETIEEAGDSLNIDTEVVSVGEVGEETPEGTKTIRIAIESEGSWSGIFAFLRAIENLPTKVTIDETSLSKVDSQWHSKIVLSLNSFD